MLNPGSSLTDFSWVCQLLSISIFYSFWMTPSPPCFICHLLRDALWLVSLPRSRSWMPAPFVKFKAHQVDISLSPAHTSPDSVILSLSLSSPFFPPSPSSLPFPVAYTCAYTHTPAYTNKNKYHSWVVNTQCIRWMTYYRTVLFKPI